jgi:membrane-associated phospholipid phosphatase
MTVAIIAGLLFALLIVLVIAHPAPFFFDRPIEVAVQSVNVAPSARFNAFVSALSGFVGVGIGAAVIALTFLIRRSATPLVAFLAIYAAVYNIVNIIVRRLLVAAAGLSRIYVGAHWPSDVAGGFLVGVAWTSLSLSLGRLSKPVLAPRTAAAT